MKPKVCTHYWYLEIKYILICRVPLQSVNTGVHDKGCIMGNQGKMAGNSKVYMETQSQIIPFILKHLRLPRLK